MLLLQIATRLGMGRATVRKFTTATVFPERAVQRRQSSIIDPYVPYLQQRRAEGCTNASHLWREIQAQGYPGVRKQVARWVQHHRSAPAPTGPKKYRASAKPVPPAAADQPSRGTAATTGPALAAPRQLVWLLLRNPSQFDDEATAMVARIQQHPDVLRAHIGTGTSIHGAAAAAA